MKIRISCNKAAREINLEICSLREEFMLSAKERETIGSHSNQTFPSVRTEEHGLEGIKFVQNMQVSKMFEPPTKTPVEARGNDRKAEKYFMTVLKTLLKGTTDGKDLIASLMGLETKNDEMALDEILDLKAIYQPGL